MKNIMLQSYKFNLENKIVYVYILLLSSIIPILSIINPILLGSDEVLTFRANVNIINYLYVFDLKNLLIELFKDFHPPGRNLFPLISIYFFGENISALRFPYYLLWIGSCFLAFKIVQNYSSNILAGILSTTLIAGSGLFHIQVLGLGHGVVTFIGLLIIYILSKHFKKKIEFIPFKEFNLISLISFIGFLFYNTFVLIIINLYLIQFFLILKSDIKYLKPFFISSFLFASLHLLYLLLFIGLPYLIVNEPSFIQFLTKIFGNLNFGNWDQKPFGQFHQYLVRGKGLSLSLQPLINNISYLNWHFFPFISIVIIPISIIYLFFKHRYIFVLLFSYFLVINFFMSWTAPGHFASFFIWLIPFFSLSVLEFSKNYKLKYLIILFSIIFISFTLFYHVKPYNEKNYPYEVVKKFNGLLIWPSNLNKPFKEISDEIIRYNKHNSKIGYTTSNAMFQYYFKDDSTRHITLDNLKILYEKKLCTDKVKKMKLEILISTNILPKPCDIIIKKVLKFDNSSIIVFLLN
tara:strand:- start:114 stop:1673 length:1560 start_codon:yes stop_codon:yes gene_type:complete